MDYVKTYLTLLQDCNKTFDFGVKAYSDMSKSLREFDKNFDMSFEFRQSIVDFLMSLKIEKLAENIFKILNPCAEEVEANSNNIMADIALLSDKQLLNYLGKVCWTISVIEKDGLILLKYNNCLHQVGWHELAKVCRGKIISASDYSIVSYPFDKFFCLNEKPEVSEKVISKLFAKAKKVYISDKVDGSMISVTNHMGNVIVNTCGAFNNKMIDMAKKLLAKEHSEFYRNIPTGFTFIFEVVYSGNHVVVNYDGLEKLFLLGIRELTDYKLYEYPQLIEISEKYGLNLVDSENFSSFEEMVEIAHTAQNANKEGWVVRIITETEDVIFKLKLEEYFTFHRANSHLSIKKIYSLLINNEFDAFIDCANDEIKEAALSIVEEISIQRQKIKDAIIEDGDNILRRYNEVQREDIPTEIVLKLINDSRNARFAALTLSYMKASPYWIRTVDNLNAKKFLATLEVV